MMFAEEQIMGTTLWCGGGVVISQLEGPRFESDQVPFCVEFSPGTLASSPGLKTPATQG